MSDKKIKTIQYKIYLTDKAIAEINRIIDENQIPDNYSLRIGVKGGGCAGFVYTMGFDSASDFGDNFFVIDGVKIVVDWKSILYLNSTTIDYDSGLLGKGFIFNNPNMKKTCGCGSAA